MKKVKLTMLNAMADKDFDKALFRQQEWNINFLDMKDNIFGKSIIDLTDEEATEAAKMIKGKNMSVYCFSSVLFYEDIEIGEREFRIRSIDKLDRLLEIAQILQPRIIRLLAARSGKRKEFTDIIPYLRQSFQWLIPMYREAVEKIHRSGFGTTIENEAHDCIFSTPAEILEFFKELDCGDKVSFTYDIQNLWQMGTFPTVESYRKLAGITGYFHLKGGKCDGGTELVWSSALDDASWPVKEIVRLAVTEEISPFFCLNSSHGKRLPGYNYDNITRRDIDYLRRNFPEIE